MSPGAAGEVFERKSFKKLANLDFYPIIQGNQSVIVSVRTADLKQQTCLAALVSARNPGVFSFIDSAESSGGTGLLRGIDYGHSRKAIPPVAERSSQTCDMVFRPIP